MVIPPVIATWRTRGGTGKSLLASYILAWAWLNNLADRRLPAMLEFRAGDLAMYWGRSCHTSALDWIEGLRVEGLVENVDTQAGAGGGVRLRLLDPYDVADHRVRRADPQRELPLEVEPDTIAFKCGDSQGYPHIHPPADAGLGEAGELEKCGDDQGYPHIQTAHVAAACPDARPALLAALTSHVGADRADVWLRSARVEATRDGLFCFFPTKFELDLVRSLCASELRQAADAAGLGAIQFAVDSSLAKCGDSPGHPHITAQQPTLVLRSSALATSKNQPTNQPDFEISEEGTALLVRARTLYDRIGDRTLWPWVAIAAELFLHDGQLSQAELDGLIAEHAEDFGTAIKELMGAKRRWPKQGMLKSRLRALGIKWKRQWERGLEPRPVSLQHGAKSKERT